MAIGIVRKVKSVKDKKQSIHIPQGFLFAAGEAGLRTHGRGPDVGLIYSMTPAGVAALFTSNRVKAAPVVVSQEHLRRTHHIARAIVVNAGNANCATGARGLRAAKRCAEAAGKLLGLPPEHVLLASTGVIGLPLDERRITDVLPTLARRMHPLGYEAVSNAILTTDTRPKVVSRTILLSDRNVHVLGMAKGSGMIYPRLATMLGFLFTDAAVEPRFLRAAASRLCNLSFNRISVDGDTSTNDTFFLMANGLAGNLLIRGNSSAAEKLFQALTEVAHELAVKMVMDGEGARKLVEIHVEGGRSERQASAIARSIGLSSLVKTALAGSDPNWGRILSAAGSANVEFDPDHADIYLNSVLVCRGGEAAEYNEAALIRQLHAKKILIRVVLKQGKAEATFWTCDFTEDYVRINASYRT